jgi:DNA invertase Pin-like site-specific DNA recombinase
MMKDVKRRRFDAVVCWKLDRLGRDMRHLINLLDELRALDVGLVTLGEGLDTTTPAGRMAFGIFASVAEFERERLRERTLLGLDRARAQGKRLGRPVDAELRVRVLASATLSVRGAARLLGCSTATVQKFDAKIRARARAGRKLVSAHGHRLRPRWNLYLAKDGLVRASNHYAGGLRTRAVETRQLAFWEFSRLECGC